MKFGLRPIKTLVAVGAMALLAHAGNYSTWGHYRTITLSTAGMGLTAPVTNFPVLVRFKASAHKDMLDSAATQVQANGSDVRVTLADGTTDVPFEIEQVSTGPDGKLHLWILASNVPTNDPTAATFRVYWGKMGQTSMSNPTATFPTSAGFQAVFHLNDTGTTILNSANASLNGTATGTSTTTGQAAGNGFVSAKSGARVRAFGSSAAGVDNTTPATDYIKFTPGPTNILSTTTGPLTIEGWIYSSVTQNGNTSPGTKTIVAHGDGNTGGKAWFARTAALDGSSAQNHYSAGGPNNIAGPISPFGEQHLWQFATAVWDGSKWTLYRQRENDFWNNPTVAGPTGMTPDSATYKIIPGTAPVASTLPWFIGGASDSTGANVNRGWQGWMDEVRISTVARDSNYVKLEFLTTRADTLASVVPPVSIGASEVPGSGPYANWSGHRTIKLNTSATGANVAGDVTNFPVLIRLGTAEASILSAANGGNSIRFSKADNATALPYQIESWSPTAAAIWVKVDTIKGNNATQTIRMHWGNGSAASESNGAAVFDTTGNAYTGVWHMNGTDGEMDATGNAYAAVATGTVPAATGNVGGARQFSGTSTYLTVANSASSKLSYSNAADFTLSAWIYADSISTAGNVDANNGHGIITKGNNQFLLGIYGTSAGNRFYEVTSKGNNTWNQVPTNATGDTLRASTGAKSWQLVTGTWSGSTANDTGKIYVNGRLYNAKGFGDMSTQGRTETFNVILGGLGGGTAPGSLITRPFIGRIDEVVMSGVVRDSNWIRLAFENEKAVNTLADIGLPQYSVPGAPTGVTAVPDTTRGVISWTAPSDNGGSAITSYKATIVGDTTLACETTTLSCVITGLQAGTSYNAVVKAINAVGAGPNSSASNAFIPLSPVAPSKPLGVSAATASATSIAVAWAVPVSNGGAAITGYTVTGVPGGTCTTTGTVCVVGGLTQGTAYKFTVVATNVIGNSPPSDTVTATTTGILPGSFLIHMDGASNPYTYRLPAASVAVTEKLSMSVTNIQGKRIWSRTINPSATQVGEITWDGRTSVGQPVAPGMYVVHVRAVINGQSLETTRKGVKQ